MKVAPVEHAATPAKSTQPELGSPGDAAEREADALAHRALHGPAPAGVGLRSAPTDPVARLEPLRGSAGQPLDAGSRAYFEPRFGVDFGRVRIHADAPAASLAHGLQAKAFAHGHDIVFSPGHHRPETAAGRRLLAHELAHVALHAGNQIHREPYHTVGIPIDRSNVATMAGSYWESRTTARYATTVDSRMNSDAEERDAVYAALWALNPPTTVTARRVMTVPINPRTIPGQGTASTQAPALLYQFVFEPPSAPDPLPRLRIRFIASGAPAVPVAAPAAPAAYTPSAPTQSNANGFSGSLDDYWAAHPDEHRALFHLLTNGPASFDQTITTTTTNRTGTVTHRSVFRVVGSHTGATIDDLNITLLSEGTVEATQTPVADYRDRDRVDIEFERLRATSIAAANRLGTVTLPTGIPADERMPVKYAIWAYFENGRARNTEVDAIVPIGSGTRSVLYTLTFAAGNNVTATRIGETGTGTGQIDTRRIDVGRVRGFPGASAATSALRTWWSTRYPQGGALTPEPPPPQGDAQAAPAITAAALITDMNRLITAGIVNRTWFNQNYGIEVLSASETATRLENTHHVPTTPTNLTADTIDFSAADMLALELSLQTLTSNEIGHLRGVKLGRKTQSLTRGSGNNYAAGANTQYGLTLKDGSERTVLYFQSLYMNDAALFRGSTAGNALPDVTMSILHELGHATGYDAGIEAAFTAWVTAHAQSSPTWYAASGTAERFPEFFALYHTDPHFLCGRYPQVYAWFEALATTGSPPAANATFPAPTCPA